MQTLEKDKSRYRKLLEDSLYRILQVRTDSELVPNFEIREEVAENGRDLTVKILYQDVMIGKFFHRFNASVEYDVYRDICAFFIGKGISSVTKQIHEDEIKG